MRIGILIHEIDQIGGMGIAVFEEVRCLINMGLDAELIVLIENNKINIEKFTKGIPIRYLSREFPRIFRGGVRIPPFNFFSTYHLTSPYAACRVLKEKEYDCIVSHGTFNCFTTMRLARVRNIPYVAFIWDPISYIVPRVYSKTALKYAFWLVLPLARYLDRLFVRNALATVTCSKAHVEFLNRLNPSQTQVVHPGCYPGSRIPSKRQDYILSLSRWDSGKHAEFLLEVLRRVKNPGTRLVMAGNWAQGSVLNNFLSKAKAYNLMQRVEITGRVDDGIKERLFSEARVLVHPIFEAFGMFGLEAASFGCPLIIPKGSGVTDLFIHEKHGFFPEEGNLGSYVTYVDMLMEDERLAWKMGQEAWEVSKQNTWEIHAQRLWKVIQNARQNN
jgi:glycosyltransferase involved in cell wall biosynthesis